MSGKQVIFDRGNGNRFRIDANRIAWNQQRYPKGYVVTKGGAPVAAATPEPDEEDSDEDEEQEPENGAPRDLTIKELRQLAKDNNVTLPSGGTRRSIIDALKEAGIEVPEAEDLGAV